MCCSRTSVEPPRAVVSLNERLVYLDLPGDALEEQGDGIGEDHVGADVARVGVHGLQEVALGGLDQLGR